MSYRQTFWRYCLPAIAGMVVTSLYVIVDGIFIGRGVGATALAAVNIVWPFLSLLQAVSMLIAIGGGTVTAIAFAEGRIRDGNAVFLRSALVLLVFAACFTLAGLIFARPLSLLGGATELLLPEAMTYLRFFSLFGVFWCLLLFLSVFVRNDGAPGLVWIAMLVGTVCNIVLDYIFIFRFGWGLMGSGLATGLGQLGGVLVLSWHFIKKRGQLRLGRLPLRRADYGHYLRAGTPEFVMQMTFPVGLLCYNWVLIRSLGEMAVAAYSVIGYITSIALAILIGMADGVQPLLSHSHGRRDAVALRAYFRRGLAANLSVAAIFYLLIYCFAEGLVWVVSEDAALIAQAVPALRVNALTIIFAAPALMCITRFLAVRATARANLISIGRAAFGLLFVPLFPLLFGGESVWAAGVWAEAAGLLLAIVLTTRQASHHCRLPING